MTSLDPARRQLRYNAFSHMLRKLVTLALAAGLLLAQESTTTIVNPFNTDLDRVEGARTYLSQCASCHGRDARGAPGIADLAAPIYRRVTSDADILQLIVKGIPGTTMPSFSLSGRETWQIVAYLNSLRNQRSVGELKGDRTRGRQVFADNGCAKCHASPMAPNLANIHTRRTVAELRRAILDPQAEVDSAWWRIQATMKDGHAISGLRLNEDTFSIQYMDAQGHLRTLPKSAIAKRELLRTSPMPRFESKLSAAQLDDLLAFLIQGDVQ